MARNKRYKTYPFPFLADYTKDYKKTTFQLDVDYKPEGEEITFKISYVIDNDELLEMIKTGTVRVAAKIKCPTMGFSRIVPIRRDHNSVSISYPSMQFDDDVEFVAYLVANEDFVMENSDLSAFWINEKSIVQANNVIGESNERIITINHLKSGSAKSIFQFTQDRSKDTASPFSISLADEQAIVFKLSPNHYALFNSVRAKEEGRRFIYSVFLIPVISDILRQMINTEKDDDGETINNQFNITHGQKKWYMVLSDHYQQAFDGKDPTEGNIPPLEAAQTIIDRFAVNNTLVAAKKYLKGV